MGQRRPPRTVDSVPLVTARVPLPAQARSLAKCDRTCRIPRLDSAAQPAGLPACLACAPRFLPLTLVAVRFDIRSSLAPERTSRYGSPLYGADLAAASPRPQDVTTSASLSMPSQRQETQCRLPPVAASSVSGRAGVRQASAMPSVPSRPYASRRRGGLSSGSTARRLAVWIASERRDALLPLGPILRCGPDAGSQLQPIQRRVTASRRVGTCRKPLV